METTEETPSATSNFSRRSLLKVLGMGAVVTTATTLLAGCGGSSNSGGSGGPSQTDVLNFALNLEYLEASFYSYAVTGAGLPSSLLGGTPTVTPVPQASLSGQDLAIFTEILADEMAHVSDLRATLGANAVPCPNLNLTAAGNPTTIATLVAISKAFEDVGVTAYAGASTLLSGPYLQAAADILAVEAFHSANLRLLIVQNGYPYTIVDANAPSPKDIAPSPTAYWATDASHIAFNRNPSEVLSIVLGLGGTLTVGTKTGGFFPNGLNGNINTITTAVPDPT